MPRRYHEALKVSPAALRRIGAFDGFVDLDSELYVDPRLLTRTRVPEFRDAAGLFEAHFRKVFRLLKQARREDDQFWEEAVTRLQFKEVTHTGLGYGKTSTRGSGVGRTLAIALARTARELLRAGIDDPDIFELLGLFQDKFGPDRVSDIAVRVILRQILDYSERVASRLGAATRAIDIDGVSGAVPFDAHPDRWFLLLPAGILTQLPVARDFSDISSVCSHNHALRAYVNERLGPAWRETLRSLNKTEVRRLLLREPGMFREIIADYRSTEPEPYDFDADPAMEFGWHQAGKAAAADNPVSLTLPATPSPHQVVDAVATICRAFARLVEDSGVWEALWDSSGRPRTERVAQRLFLTVADSYCRANNLDLSPEANAGAGPVDFKMSHGYDGRVLVELKRSGNSQLAHGYGKQLELYKTAEQTTHGFFVIVDFGDRNERAIESIVRRAKRAERQGKPFSRVIVVDASQKESASVASY